MNGNPSSLKEILQSSFFPIYRSLLLFFVPMVGLIVSNTFGEGTVKITPEGAAGVMLMLGLNLAQCAIDGDAPSQAAAGTLNSATQRMTLHLHRLVSTYKLDPIEMGEYRATLRIGILQSSNFSNRKK